MHRVNGHDDQNDNIKKEQKSFYRALLALVLPIAMQNLITNAVNSADVFMLGYVGQTELAAVSLANQFHFLLSGLFFGICSGVTMLASQYFGKKNMDAIQAIIGIGLKIGFCVCVLMTLAAFLIPEQLMRIYTDDGEMIAVGAQYLRVISISYLCMSFSQVYMCALRSMERARLSMLISFAALGTNVLLNAVFIFGIGGAPRLGVFGVALGTSTARVIELLLCLLDAHFGRGLHLRWRLVFGKNTLLFQDFIRYATPALINDGAWTFAFSTYSVILGHLNADMVAASSVATAVRDLCSILCFAIASGASVLLGIEIGEGRLEAAKRDAGRSCRVTLLIGALTGGFLLCIRPYVACFFDLTERAEGYLMLMLLISSYYVIGQAINTLLISGVFRAGGNSRFGMICDIIVMWGISVPLGFFGAFVLKLPPMAVYLILCLDELWKLLPVYRYYKSYRWLNDITRSFDQPLLHE